MKSLVDNTKRYLEKKSTPVVTLIALAIVVGMGTIDSATGSEISLAIFYLMPIAMATWYGGRWSGAIIGIASAITWLVADFILFESFSHPTIPLWNLLVRLATFLIVVYLLGAVKLLNTGLEEAVREKTAALKAEMTERARVEKAVLEISREEQRRIAHELHDGLGQVLTYSALKARMLSEDLSAIAPAQALVVDEVVGLLNDGTRQVRRIARGLDPIDIENSGLTAALERLAKETENLGKVRCSFTFNRADLPLDPGASLHLYRMTQEAITNAIKHGKCKNIGVELTFVSGKIALRITDDGTGFDPEKSTPSSMGLRIMRYRAHTLGGKLVITANSPSGTVVHCTISAPLHTHNPLPDEWPSYQHAEETHSSSR